MSFLFTYGHMSAQVQLLPPGPYLRCLSLLDAYSRRTIRQAHKSQNAGAHPQCNQLDGYPIGPLIAHRVEAEGADFLATVPHRLRNIALPH